MGYQGYQGLYPGISNTFFKPKNKFLPPQKKKFLVNLITKSFKLFYLTADKNSLHPLTTDINQDSNTETNKNISSEQSDTTLTLIPVSRSNHDSR